MHFCSSANIVTNTYMNITHTQTHTHIAKLNFVKVRSDLLNIFASVHFLLIDNRFEVVCHDCKYDMHDK